MAELVLTNVDDLVLDRLRGQAVTHGRTPVEEAKEILSGALAARGKDPWAEVDAIYRRLSQSGRAFSDSADLLRQDRER